MARSGARSARLVWARLAGRWLCQETSDVAGVCGYAPFCVLFCVVARCSAHLLCIIPRAHFASFRAPVARCSAYPMRRKRRRPLEMRERLGRFLL